MKYIVAVSGGVDSIVLLDMMAEVPGIELIVAHFDHGIREDSAQDAEFVQKTAEKYGLAFYSHREELGNGASEALARERRYAFLRDLAKQHDANILTAHHLDDLVETVAINLTRGTGWRGLTPLDSDIIRPFIDTPKEDLLLYAKAKGLQWREDSTNTSDVYLRNRIRAKSKTIDHGAKRELRALHSHQKALKREIEQEVAQIIGEGPTYDRHQLIHMQTAAALECLRGVTKGRLTRPQLSRALLAVKTASPGSVIEVGSGVRMHFTTRHFTL